jgi:putative peptidoglycan lipid II flippase
VVAAGIFLSRLTGLLRQRILAHFLGLGEAADAFAAAFRIPNFLQNLLGEGVLSASFIPVYARLTGQGRAEEARRVAGTVLSLLFLMTGLLVALGVTFAPELVLMLAPGFAGPKRDLTIRLVRILFPGVGLLVFSAWCLGILNSHRRFFLSYAAPVVWNAAIIVATLIPSGAAPEVIVVWTAWGAVSGSLIQLLVQLPGALRAAGGVRPLLATGNESVRVVIRNFGPAFVGRGVVQISAFVDAILASLLPTGAVAAVLNAQLLYTLPVSLFGMSVAAAELPALSVTAGQDDEGHVALRSRIERAAAQIAFFVVPSVVAFLVLGKVIAAALFQTGRFSEADTEYVWAILAGATVGLLAATLARLYASAWYALQDTRRPLRYAVVRVGLTVVLGYLAALQLPDLLGIERQWGAVGLTASAGLAGWVEFVLLRRSLQQRIGPIPAHPNYLLRLSLAAAAAAAGGAAGWVLAGDQLGSILLALLVLGIYGALYLGLTWLIRIPAALELAGRLGLTR